MAPRLWKALATIIALALLIFMASPRFMPKELWVVLLIITLTYGISLLFSTKIAFYRRWGIAYLVFVAASYLLAGIAGLVPNWDLIATTMWYSLISPLPLFALVAQCAKHYPCSIYGLTYAITPLSDEHFRWFSAAATLISLIAIIAAFSMTKRKRLAYNVWLAFVGMSILSSLAYIAADIANWGGMPGAGTHSGVTIASLSWSASYLAAYVMARKGAGI